MIDMIDPALAAHNDTGAMAVLNELAMAMTADGGGATLDSALREVAASRGGEAALGQMLREALAGSASHGAIAVLDLLIDKLDIDPAERALAGPSCGCKSRGGAGSTGGELDGGIVLSSFADSSSGGGDSGGSGGDDGGDYIDENGNGQYDEGEPILVNGTTPKTVDDDSGYEGDPGSDIGSGDEGAVGGGDMPGENDTPCVDQKPTGVDLNEVNDLAKIAASDLATRQEDTGWEWGAFIYRGVDGQLHISEPFTARRPDSLTGAIANVPPGSYIVGYVHTHPVNATMDERMLSDDDRAFINQVANDTSGSITGDPNMIAYVVTKDNASGYELDEYKTYVYDKSERNSDRPGCTL